MPGAWYRFCGPGWSLRAGAITGSNGGAGCRTRQESARAQRCIMAATVTFTKPNLYTLHGGGIHVSYSTSGFDGKPHFTYQDVHGSQSFSDTQINVAGTPIGDVVTVTIRRTVDAGSTSFSVLIPTVNLTGLGHPEHIHTDGITTIHRFSIVPAFNQGQTELYHFTPLSGTAEQVAF